jgi:hypothetical protein
MPTSLRDIHCLLIVKPISLLILFCFEMEIVAVKLLLISKSKEWNYVTYI